MKRISLDDAECAVARSLDVIGDWWSLLIVRDAFSGICRFGEFQKSLGIARGILTTRLRELVASGVLALKPASDGTSYQEYTLTEKGAGLFPVIVALRQWGEDNLYKSTEQKFRLIDIASAQPVARLKVQAHDGRELAWQQTRVTKSAPTPRKTAAARGRA